MKSKESEFKKNVDAAIRGLVLMEYIRNLEDVIMTHTDKEKTGNLIELSWENAEATVRRGIKW